MAKGCSSTAITGIFHAAIHLTVYANSVLLTAQLRPTIVPPATDVIGGLSVAATLQTGVCVLPWHLNLQTWPLGATPA